LKSSDSKHQDAHAGGCDRARSDRRAQPQNVTKIQGENWLRVLDEIFANGASSR